MKRTMFILFGGMFTSVMYAQLTWEECQWKTQQNYPLVRQYELVEKTMDYNLSNAAKGYLLQLSLSAKASYQSEVTELPIKIPGIDIKGMPKDQYLLMLEWQQKIWDGGGIRLEQQMQDDDEIIRLRTNIRKSAKAKVANGTLTVKEMLRELTNESLARQMKALHEIQRLMALYQLKYTTNN